VAKLNSIRVILSVAANLDWPLHQLDIKNAFLNGELEEVYMTIPLGLENPRTVGKVCKLRKSLYGLKQSPRAWVERLTRVVKGNGFVQCQTDHTMFVKHSLKGSKIALFIVYVDDIVIIGDDHEEIEHLKKLLTKEFEVKDLGKLKYFLGMKVVSSKNGISMSQRKYTMDLLKEIGMLGCKPIDTPMDPTKKGGWKKRAIQLTRRGIKDLWENT